MQKRWIIKEENDNEIIDRLARDLNINPVLSNLLTQRGITDFDSAKKFFRPGLDQLHDPFLMTDMVKAVDRILSAISKDEKILVYGDYDVDGTTAVALVYSFLRRFYDKLDYYIPDRYMEGYGISVKGVDYASDNGFSLVIALDCGIKANTTINYAHSKGVDFIVCDHHRPGDEIPQAYAVLDPKRPDCMYPYKELSGCGIGFKLIQALAQKKEIAFDEITRYLDLVVVSIASDIVPITGENRILAFFGLKLVNTNPCPGIESILRFSGINKQDISFSKKTYSFSRELTISDLVFLVGPRINAAGRIESGKNSVELLISPSLEEANDLAVKINLCNNERKTLDSSATEQALKMIEESEQLRNRKTTVLFNSEWHKGVVGIVASRLTETYYRPTIILTSSNGLITGSARSIKNFDIYDAIDACGNLLEHFGGHKYAAGLSLKPENLEAFTEKFEEIVNASIEDDMLIPEIEIDAVISLNDISNGFYNILKQFAPFGPDNMSPVFMTEGVKDAGNSRVVGEKHIRLNIFDPDKSGFPMQGIAFQQSDYFDKIKQGTPFNICYHLEENEWNGNVYLQLNVKDIRF